MIWCCCFGYLFVWRDRWPFAEEIKQEVLNDHFFKVFSQMCINHASTKMIRPTFKRCLLRWRIAWLWINKPISWWSMRICCINAYYLIDPPWLAIPGNCRPIPRLRLIITRCVNARLSGETSSHVSSVNREWYTGSKRTNRTEFY